MNTQTRILIIEDDACIAHEINRILGILGYMVTSVVVSGSHVLQQVEQDIPDLIVDIGLSGKMDGIKTAEQSRSKHDIPILYLTAHWDQDLIERAEEALRKQELKASEARFRELFNNMSSGVAVYETIENGQDFIFKDFNRAGERIDKVQKDDLIGKSVLEMFPGVKEFGLFEVFQRVWRTGKPEHHPISLYKDERIVGWRENYVYKLPSGEIVAVYDDITKRKQAEEELIKHREHLEELVKERTIKLQQEIEERKRTEEELAKAKEAAESASHAKSEFLANMSHELRTPLNAILGYAQILRDANNLTDQQQKGLNTIKSSGEHLLNMINDILDLSKIEAGQQELQESEFYFPEFLKNITNIIQVRAEQKGIVFVYESDLDLPEGVCADEKRLQEVLINLLDNAVKFTEKGRVTFRVAHQYPPTPLKGGTSSLPSEGKSLLEGGRGVLRFQVEDTGIGIAPEKVEEIFLPFQQVGTKRYAVEGTGLGLAITYRLIHIMGGELHVQSTPGKGSTFWFDLNLRIVEDVAAKVTKPFRQIVGYTGKRRKILIVDDQIENRRMLVDRLCCLGFDILEAANGQECVKKTLNDKPDVILLDLLMPVMDGFEAVQHIQELDTGYSILDTGLEHLASGIRHPVIIAVSASAYEETREKSLEAGCDDFLSKPIQFETLLERLQSHLHLEWLYKGEIKEAPKIDIQTTMGSSQVMSLSPEETATLLDLARLGIVKQILSELDKLEQHHTKYAPVVKVLRQFAKNYQFDRIIEFLEKRSGANDT